MASGPLITAEDLGLGGQHRPVRLPESQGGAHARGTAGMIQALAMTSGNVSHAAELLGVTRPTLYDLMEKYDCRDATRE